jgi:tetrahydromethanopterin S-methyltransferase subunit G
VFVGARVGRTVSVTVGIVVGLGCIKLEQATRINIGKRRLAAMGFFTGPSL